MSRLSPILQPSLDDFNRWWNVLRKRVQMTAKATLPNTVVQPVDLLTEEAQGGWQEVQTRLLLLTIDPADSEGRAACGLIFELTRILGELGQAAINNKSGVGFVRDEKGKVLPADRVVDAQISSVEALLGRLDTVRVALQQISGLSQANANFPAPPGQDNWGAAPAWQRISDRFYQERYSPLRAFRQELIEFRNQRDFIIQQIEGALTSGRLHLVELDAIHSDFRNHPTKQYLEALLDEKKRLYTELKDLNDRLKSCLDYQQIDATPWGQQPVADPQASPLAARAIKLWNSHRERASTPTEFKSLLEAAWELLGRMKKEDSKDSCGFQERLRWVNASGGTSVIGFNEVEPVLRSLIEETNELRRWLHPITGGQLYQASIDLQGNSYPDSSQPVWSVIPYLTWRTNADQARRKGEFAEAIRILEVDILDDTRNAPPAAEGQPPAHRSSGEKTLPLVIRYLRHENPLQWRPPQTGVGSMLANYARQLLAIYECEQNLAYRSSETLRNWEAEYDSKWRTFEADLDDYRGKQNRAARAVLMKDARRDEAARAQAQAISSYYQCHELCPEQPELRAQRSALGILDSDPRLKNVRQLWTAQDDCNKKA